MAIASALYDERALAVAAAYIAGESCEEIVTRFSLRHKENIYRHLTRAGVSARRKAA